MKTNNSFISRYSLHALLSIVLLAVLTTCGSESEPDSPQASTAPAEQAPAPSLESAEGVLPNFGPIQTHWLNTSPIGNGLAAVSNELLEVSDESTEHWLQYGGGYSNFRHSPITELSPENVDRLEFAWGFPSGTDGQFATSPVIYDGIMYVTSSYNRLFALNAASGELYWRYDHPQPADLRICCGPTNRGVAIIGDRVLMATLDARLLAFDRKSGEILWDTEIIDYKRGFSATSAPLIVKDLAIIGIAGG
ncbi:MAG: PQQ-binding-like beta-propeller repeat protein, partial [Pseudomonadales bacterium]|nr:PQQ-binding-like beta-propeller repeat protein [Pseudomonadales bacterium]